MKFATLALVLGCASAFSLKVDGEEIGAPVSHVNDLGKSYAEQTKGTQFKVEVEKFGKSGIACRNSDTAKMTYTGKFADGTVFDSTDKSNFGMPMKFIIGQGQVIPCLDTAFTQMHVGSKATITCPPDVAYGSEGSGPVPPNTPIFFDVEVVNCETTF